ncbi:Toll-like receptor [Mactra antiquata]
MRIVFLLLVIWCQSASSYTCIPYSQPWQPGWSDIERDDLRCFNTACDITVPHDHCCLCRTCMSWEGTEKNIDIDYISVSGKSLAVFAGEFNQSDVYRIQHIHSNLSEIPSNICDWDKESYTSLSSHIYQTMSVFWGNVVELNFADNLIRTIPDINCLERLDKLDLSNNRIIHVSNSSFNKLSRLRHLNLDRNKIKYLDINILSAPKLNLLSAYLSNNFIETLDISNVISSYPFCHIDYTNNYITKLVRENFVLDINKPPGPGFVTLKGNQIKEFPNAKDLLNLASWDQIGILTLLGFDFRDIPLVCDCNVEPLVEVFIVHLYWLDHMKLLTCASPPEYAGMPLADLKIDQLVCNVSQEEGCTTPECTCVDKPSEDTMYINCANSNLKEMPNIPKSVHSKYISLNVSGNDIQTIKNETYLSRVTSLDISHNDLREINNGVIELLENCTMLNISNNPKITKLPRMIQYRPKCSTQMNNLLVHCDCDTLWIETWLKHNVCSSDHMFQCNIPDKGVTLATDFKESDLECNEETAVAVIASIISTGIVLMIIIGFTVHSFKYESLILYLRSRRITTNAAKPMFTHDVFISYNENEDHIREWIMKYLNPRLMESGYTTFFASRDAQYGAERNAEVISAIQNSRHFLIVLSEHYLSKADEGIRSWTENEWKYGWHNFRDCPNKNIVLVNFDHMKPSDVEHPAIKAYLRVGYTVDFRNQDRNIMDEIEEKLGGPTKNAKNKKAIFSCKALFIVRPYQFSAKLDDTDFENIINTDDVDDGQVNFTYA